MAELYKANDTGAVITIMNKKLPTEEVIVSDTDGNVSSSGITLTELNALDGVTGNIQTQIDSKSSMTATVTGKLLSLK